MPKKPTTAGTDLTAETEGASAGAAAVPAEALPMPTKGGCWVRLPDGTLVPDPAEHPADDTAAT
jgi:hypothetical protein